jgi:hypothetical protein
MTRFPFGVFNPRLNPNINPNFQIAPGLSVSQAAFNIRVLGRALQSVPPFALGYNPYASALMNSYGYRMYPMSMPYYPTTMRSSGYPDVAPAAFGATTGAGSQTAAPYTARENNGKAGVFQGLISANGGLDWPLALRILPPSLQTTPLRERIDSLVQQVQTEAGKGKVDSALLKEANHELNQLRERLAEKGDFLPVSQQATADAKEFVRRLQSALKTLE